MIIFIKTLSSQITKNKVICRASIVFTVEYYFYIEATFMPMEFWQWSTPSGDRPTGYYADVELILNSRISKKPTNATILIKWVLIMKYLLRFL